MDSNSHSASGVVDAAKDKAGDLAQQAKSTATEKLEQGKSQATGVLGDAADALHDTADALRDHDNDAFARYAEAAANQVGEFTEAIRGKSVGELLDQAEAFARRDPGLFLGGAFVMGIFGARFLKATAPQRMSSQRRAAGSGSYGGRSYASSAAYGATGSYGSGRAYGSAVPTRSTPTGSGMTRSGQAGSPGTMQSGSMGAGETGTGLPSGASRIESRTGTPHLPSMTGSGGSARTND